MWQGQKDLNPRHAVLETAALPTELYPYILFSDSYFTIKSDYCQGFFQKTLRLCSASGPCLSSRKEDEVVLPRINWRFEADRLAFSDYF